jgi:hypothetical protein
MSFTNFLETEILDHVFGGASYTAPATIYVALFTSAPDDTGAGTEVSGTGYVRQGAAFTVSGNNASNTSAVEFPTAGADWGTVTHGAVYDAETGGNMLGYGTLAVSKVVGTGDIFRIGSNDLDINLD